MYDPWLEGYYTGYGRLVDYWRDLSRYSDGTGPMNNVPNILDELRRAMGTDVNGTTYTNNIGWGILYVTNTLNGYCFSSGECTGYWQDDYCYGTIMNEINYMRPFVWSNTTTTIGHSLAAWGYTDQKYVMTYNTWNYGTDYWYYAMYDNSIPSYLTYVDTAVPGCPQGPQGTELYLYQPVAGQTLTIGQNYTISWLAWPGADITNVDLLLSTNGGATWSDIDTNIPTVPGWNYYTWNVQILPSSTVRVWVRGYDANRNYLAGTISY